MPSRFVRSAVMAAAMFLTAGPAGLADHSRPAGATQPDVATTVHVLNRVGFGPRPGDVDRVRQIGIEAYIEEQLRPGEIKDDGLAPRLAALETLGMSSRELAENYFMPASAARRRTRQGADRSGTGSMAAPGAAPTEMRSTPMPDARRQRALMGDLQQQKILRAVYSQRQLEEVMVDFWFNHFNVFAGKGPARVYIAEYERDVIRPRAFGKFRELLGAVAESPAMLFYLDNWQSAAPSDASTRDGRAAQRRRPRAAQDADMAQPNPKRPPRGLNENYARELMELHTLGVDGGYTQWDVQEVARAFSGWTITTPRQGGGFRFDPRLHDRGEKVVLGQRMPGGRGQQDGEQVLDILAKHPSTARFIATKLARRFVSDEPPTALVDRAAARFLGTGGDIREVVRTILVSPEFMAPAARRAKVKTPFEFVVSAVRATAIESRSALPLANAVRQLGMPLYLCQPPTGYADRASAWVNTGALLARMNFALSLTRSADRAARGTKAGTAGPDDLTSLRDRMVRDVLGGTIAESTSATVAKATQPAEVVALLIGSPDFQKR